MGKINILDKKVYNRIAAGEVVDRPYSVVKELVENSIDAGASEIIIDIVNGGIDYIGVTDNGCGLEKDDLIKAFIPHATSKIKKYEDIEKISSKNIRGLVRKIRNYIDFLKNNAKYKTKFYDIGDGISVTERRL